MLSVRANPEILGRVDARSRTESAVQHVPPAMPEPEPSRQPLADAVLRLQRGAGNRAVAELLSTSPPGRPQIARMLHRSGKPIDAKYAVKSLTSLAEKAGLKLDFAAHAEAVEKLRLAAEPAYDLNTQKDAATLVNIFNHVSGESLTLESAPRIVKEKKDPPPLEAPSPEKGKEKETPGEKRPQPEDIVAEMVHPTGENQFVYRWGGTSRLESALRTLHGRVEKNVRPDGARVLIAGSATYVETSSPFPVSADVPIRAEQENAIAMICEQFGLTTPGAIRYVTDLFRISLAKKTQTPGIKRQITAFLLAFKEELADESELFGRTLNDVLGAATAADVYEEIIRSPHNAVVEALTSIAGMEPVPSGDRGLIAAADSLIAEGILETATWKAARTEEEFAGVVGEHLSHQQIAAVMPGAPATMPKDAQLVQLHSVHFIGDRYAHGDSKPTRTDTDACAELDLMTVIHHPDGRFECIAIGNTKISKTSRAGEAATQNRDAIAAVRSFIEKKRTPLPSGPLIEILVTTIVGKPVGRGAPVKLTPLTLAESVEERKIGEQDAGGEYTHKISVSYRRVHAIALILRGRMKRG